MNDLFPDTAPDNALDHMEDKEIRAKWPAALVDMTDVAAAALARDGVDVAIARRQAVTVMRALAIYHGGRKFYLPNGEALDRALRNMRIWDDFNGNNVDDLARRYRLSDVQIYAILSEQRTLHRRKTQPDLFPDPAA